MIASELAPEHALPLVRRALRSKTPFVVADGRSDSGPDRR
jgi:hypothetical protein